MLLVAALAAAMSCERGTGPSGASAPTPVRLTVVLTTPHADDGAIVFEIAGQAVATPRLMDTTMSVFSESISPTLTRLVVVGDLTSGPLLTVEAPDSQQQYVAHIIAASDRANVPRDSVPDYRMAITP